jgi:hypothetical protein
MHTYSEKLNLLNLPSLEPCQLYYDLIRFGHVDTISNELFEMIRQDLSISCLKVQEQKSQSCFLN